MEQFKPPEPFSFEGNLSENWRRWEQRFRLYLEASGAIEKSELRQCAMLLASAGEEAIEVYNNFVFGPDEKDKLECLVQKFKEYCNPRKNTVFERYSFWHTEQKEGESIDQFVTELKTKAKACEFGDQLDLMIRDRIVFGVRDVRMKERMLRDSPDLTLQKAVDMCRAAETTQAQMKTMQAAATAGTSSGGHGSERVTSVHAMAAARPTSRSAETNYRKDAKFESAKFDCGKCGFSHKPRSCPAFGKSCAYCKEKNHYIARCPKKAKIHSVAEEGNEFSVSELYIGEIKTSVHSCDVGRDTAWYADAKVYNDNVKFKLDTGAETNILPLKVYANLKQKKHLCDTETVLSSYGDFKIRPNGYCVMPCHTATHTADLEFYVADVPSSPILGLKALQQLNLVQKVDVVNTADKDALLQEYSDVFTGLGCLDGEYHIEVDKSVPPVIHPPRKVPYSLQGKLKETLDRLEAQGVVARVEKPTDWVNSLVIVEKSNGSLRLCLDPKDLNRAIKREHHRIPTAEDVASTLAGKKIFSILDEKDGYWQVQLDDESSFLCTFNSPFGRYRFKRMPFGIRSASEVFQRKNEAIFTDIPGVHIISDDLIMAAESEAEHDQIVRKVLDRAREKKVKFNPSKFQFRVREVKYVGLIVSEDGLRPDPDKIKAILDMPTPTDVSGVRRLLGMILFLQPFLPDLSEILSPLHSLLKSNTQWSWHPEHDLALDQVKKLLTSDPLLKFFDPNKPVVLQADASQHGLGACLFQEGHPVTYASRSLTDTETRYAQIEKELLAIVFACEKFNQFVYGRHFVVQSDHKPLESILRKPLSQAASRLLRMLLRLQKYDLTVNYVPGKHLKVADTLSRAYLETTETEDDGELTVHSITENLPVSPEKLAQLQEATAQDEVLQSVLKLHRTGWPSHRRQIPIAVKRYWDLQGRIHEADGLLFLDHKLIVPAGMRQEMLGIIHESHLGMEKCKSRARQVIYWPGMAQDIESVVAECGICAKFRAQNPREPLNPHPVPERPWEKLGADIFEYKNKDYLIVVDYFSKYPELCQMKDKTAKTVIQHMKAIFSRHGIPDELVSDNMPFSSRDFHAFAREWGFVVTTSSPRYPQSNGMSERAIQTVKKMLRKADEDHQDPYMALLEYRNTPVTGLSYSPAQLLMSRKLRDKLPTTHELLRPKVALRAREELTTTQARQKLYYDRGTKPLKTMTPDQMVRVRRDRTWEPAVLVGPHGSPRSHVVTTPEGGIYRRNRRHLLPTREPPPVVVGPPIDNDEPTALIAEPDTVPPPADSQPETPVGNIANNACRVPSGRVVKLPKKYQDYIMG